MKVILQQSERDKLLNSLSEYQSQFLKEHMKSGKKTIFANEMAKDKGMVIPENATEKEIQLLLNEWVLEDYIDNGVVNPNTPCECGRALRYQYIVRHLTTGETRRFGLKHTGLSAELVRLIKQGFASIEYELDELLMKIRDNWKLKEHIEYIPDDVTIPSDIQKQLDLELPLWEPQLKRLRKLVAEYFDLRSYNAMLKQSAGSGSQKPKVKIFSFDEKTYVLSEILQEAILEYLNQTSSARIITELLIKHNGACDSRYSTGKPKLYVNVCMFLDELVKKQQCSFVESNLFDDRIYQKSV